MTMSRKRLLRRLAPVAAVAITVSGLSSPLWAQDAFIGQIKAFAFDFCPRGWVEADGRLMAIASNTALFSLYGTFYGGDGRSTFGIPNLKGRFPIHNGRGPGLSAYRIGEMTGVETVTLTTSQIPSHKHTVNATASVADQVSPKGTFPAYAHDANGGEVALYHDGPQDATFNTASIGSTGGGQPHENRPPYLVLRHCVATVGVYPSRP